MSPPRRVSAKVISRLCFYRRLLAGCLAEDIGRIYSHELAKKTSVSAAQVRRDFMTLGYSGTPKNGYEVRALADSITAYLDLPGGQQAALVGVGNLGKAVLSYFSSRGRALRIAAVFDNDPEKTGRTIHGSRCYAPERMPAVVRSKGITLGIVTVPAAAAQKTVDLLVGAGVGGILNFAPVAIETPPGVYVENMDLSIAFETVAFFARKGRKTRSRG